MVWCTVTGLHMVRCSAWCGWSCQLLTVTLQHLQPAHQSSYHTCTSTTTTITTTTTTTMTNTSTTSTTYSTGLVCQLLQDRLSFLKANFWFEEQVLQASYSPKPLQTEQCVWGWRETVGSSPSICSTCFQCRHCLWLIVITTVTLTTTQAFLPVEQRQI